MKRRMKYLGMLVLCLCCLFAFKPMTVNAAMADEAEDYELGTEYNGYMYEDTGHSYYRVWRYFKFTVDEKSRVTLSIDTTNGNFACHIYNQKGKEVLKDSDVLLEENQTTGILSGKQSRLLPAGTYYLMLEGRKAEFNFLIQAEKQIKFDKGVIKSLKSKKKGQMTIKCKSADNAIGYRIQYSTDYKFKKGVKTYYSPTADVTIKKLKAGKYYYVKICPFTVYDDGSYVFGQNSYVKKVYIKKK